MQKDQTQTAHLQLIYTEEIWEPYIKPILTEIAENKLTGRQIISKIQTLYFHSQCLEVRKHPSKFKSIQVPNLKVLVHLYEKELPALFGAIAQYVLDYSHKQIVIPLFQKQIQQEHTFAKDEILLVMCLMCFLLIPQSDNFDFIFSEVGWKTTTIVEYIRKELQSLAQTGKEHPTAAQFKDKLTRLTLRRKVIKENLEQVFSKNQQLLMLEPRVAHDKQSIEEYYGDCKVDFANKYIGGGSLHWGCVQEEIMFANHPEMYVSMVLCDVMDDNEAIQFIGFKKYFRNKGYGSTCEYDGQETIKYEYDDKNRAKQYIVGVDAIPFPSESRSSEQFDQICIEREVIKAYAGFVGTEGSKIVTGNWGCGAFNGNIPLKFMIQWIASSLAGKHMVYVPFGHSQKVKNQKLFQKLKNVKVKQVYKDIIRLGGKVRDSKASILEALNSQKQEK